MRPIALSLAAFAALTPIAAALAQGPVYTGDSVRTVTSTLIDTAGKPVGHVQLNQDKSGVVSIVLDATQIPAGVHGIHVHATGKCEGPGFTSAGGHFNPGNRQHGLSNPAGAHAGDLDQIDTKTVKLGYYAATTNRISLTGGATSIYDADGTALVIHAAADDQVTDPTGNSGGRIACAVLAEPNAALATPSPVATPRAPAAGTGLAPATGPAVLPFALLGALAAIGGAVAVSARRRK